MSARAVYDTMVFLQWAALPADRQHATARAVYEGTIELCLSQDALDEVRSVLNRPNLAARSPNLTAERVAEVLKVVVKLAQWFPEVPKAFTWPQHPDDDHILNLAIESKAEYLVTWEARLLKLATDRSPEAQQFRSLAPGLRIIEPPAFAAELRRAKERDDVGHER